MKEKDEINRNLWFWLPDTQPGNNYSGIFFNDFPDCFEPVFLARLSYPVFIR